MAEMTLEELRARLYPTCDDGEWFARDDLALMVGGIDAAIKQCEQDKQDAARYRWLRDKSGRALQPYIRCDDSPFEPMDYWITAGTADTCIDRAMAKESGNG